MGGISTYGSYVGDGVNGKAIAGLGYSPQAIAVHHHEGGFGYFFFRNAAMTGDGMLSSGASHAFMIQSLNADGFTIGSSGLLTSANRLNEHYDWIAWADNGIESADFAQGKYTGNGISPRAINTGIVPAAVWCGRKDTGLYQWRSAHSAPANSFRWFNGGGWVTGAISSSGVGATSFTVGASLNTAGIEYFWCAWKLSQYFCAVGQINGNGLDNRDILHPVGYRFSPQLVTTDCQQVVISRQATWHTNAYSSGDLTFTMRDGFPVLIPNIIQGNNANGFQVGSNDYVNRVNETYYYTSYGAGPYVPPPSPTPPDFAIPISPWSGACSPADDTLYQRRES